MISTSKRVQHLEFGQSYPLYFDSLPSQGIQVAKPSTVSVGRLVGRLQGQQIGLGVIVIPQQLGLGWLTVGGETSGLV